MQGILHSMGISDDRIIPETESLDTFQNLRNCKKLIDVERDRIFIVTSDYHIFRTGITALSLGYKKFRTVPARSDYSAVLSVKEALAVVKNVVTGHIRVAVLAGRIFGIRHRAERQKVL